MLLLLPRLLWKCEILLSYIREKFPSVDKIHRGAVIKEDAIIRFSCGSRLAFYLHYLQMVLHQYLHGMDSCSSEILLAAGSKYPELAVQERTVDSYIVSVKEDRLDENVLTDPLEKCGQVCFCCFVQFLLIFLLMYVLIAGPRNEQFIRCYLP